MEHTLFECNSCSYVIFVAVGARAPQSCPYCRGGMYAVGVYKPPAGTDYTCGECGYEFRIPAGASPAYKCARCNFTFPSTPGRRVDHRL
jgi:DNA-directed RNA polymerase subunit RPC12/RpoP